MLVTVVVFIMIIEMPNKQQRVQDNQNIKKRALLIASVDKKRQILVTELMASAI